MVNKLTPAAAATAAGGKKRKYDPLLTEHWRDRRNKEKACCPKGYYNNIKVPERDGCSKKRLQERSKKALAEINK